MSDTARTACTRCPWGAIEHLERKWIRRINRMRASGPGEFQNPENHRGAIGELECCRRELSDLMPPPSWGPPSENQYDDFAGFVDHG